MNHSPARVFQRYLLSRSGGYGSPEGVAFGTCWNSPDGTGSLARVRQAICWAVCGTSRAAMRAAMAWRSGSVSPRPYPRDRLAVHDRLRHPLQVRCCPCRERRSCRGPGHRYPGHEQPGTRTAAPASRRPARSVRAACPAPRRQATDPRSRTQARQRQELLMCCAASSTESLDRSSDCSKRASWSGLAPLDISSVGPRSPRLHTAPSPLLSGSVSVPPGSDAAGYRQVGTALSRRRVKLQERDRVAPRPILAAAYDVDAAPRQNEGSVVNLKDPSWIR